MPPGPLPFPIGGWAGVPDLRGEFEEVVSLCRRAHCPPPLGEGGVGGGRID